MEILSKCLEREKKTHHILSIFKGAAACDLENLLAVIKKWKFPCVIFKGLVTIRMRSLVRGLKHYYNCRQILFSTKEKAYKI